MCVYLCKDTLRLFAYKIRVYCVNEKKVVKYTLRKTRNFSKFTIYLYVLFLFLQPIQARLACLTHNTIVLLSGQYHPQMVHGTIPTQC